MGILGRIFPRRTREEHSVDPQIGKPTPKAPRRKSGAPRTRAQIVGRRRAMLGRKANVQRLRRDRAS